MRELFSWVFLFIIFVGCFAAIADFGLNAVDRMSRYECLKWREEAWTMPDYYLTKWQSDQCNYVGIYVAAPVK